MHPIERANTIKILHGELFYHYPEIIALERALERMGCLEPVPFGGGGMGCRMSTDKGRLLLAAILHEGDTNPPPAQRELIGELSRTLAARLAGAAG